MSENWSKYASCAGMLDLFYKDDDDAWVDLKFAKALCRSCPVKDECLDEAVVNRELEGIWRSYFAFS